ncbi:MAG: lysophospholipid acyltransferase family protein [Thermodesulfobacteriota bacterium]
MRKLGMALAAVLYRLLVRWLLFASCRVTMAGEGLAALERRLAAGKPLIIAFWHYGVLLVPCLHRGFPLVAMVSASRDGDYIARILEGFGVRTVRGSRNRSGTAALKGLIAAMSEGRSAILVADGSQGPARQAQPGAVLLAGRSGCPIFPLTWSADRYWTFGSWDRTILPKPFARVTALVGAPVAVTAGSDRDAIEDGRQRLEAELDRIYRQAWAIYGRERHAEGER